LNETFERLPTAHIKNDEDLSCLSNSYNESKKIYPGEKI